MDSTFFVRDERPEGWFRIDHALLEEYGKDMGPYGIAVYTALAHHVNAQRSCWPSYARLAKLTGMSRVKVITTIDNLERLGVIRKETRKVEGMDEHTTNRYILVPLSAVVPLPRAEVVNDVNHGGKRREPPQYTTDTTLVNDVNHGGKRREPKQESLNKNQEQERETAPAPLAPVDPAPPYQPDRTRTPDPIAPPAPPRPVKPIPVLAVPLPDDYPLTDEMRAWAQTHTPTLNGALATEHAKFCAYYRSIAHDKKLGRRSNWRPVWELWMTRAAEGEFSRKAAGQAVPIPPPAPPLPRLDKAYWQAQKGR